MTRPGHLDIFTGVISSLVKFSIILSWSLDLEYLHMLWMVFRTTKKTPADNWLECLCQFQKTCSRWRCLIHKVWQDQFTVPSVLYNKSFLCHWEQSLCRRDEKSQLLLGTRHANRQQPALSSSVISSDSMHIGILAAAAHAAANNSPFTIFYNPR